MRKSYHRVLTIAGSDSSGGAGIQADLKTFSALGCYGISVITALTAQSTKGVSSIYAIPSGFIREQMDAVLEDMGADAIKIGMLYSKESVIAVSQGLEKHHGKNIVLDPLLVSHDGMRLLEEEAVRHLKDTLIPLSTLVTPNIQEASFLLGKEISGLETMHQAARAICSWGPESVLIKGGHLSGGTSTDVLYMRHEGRFVLLKKRRVKTKNDHGTGCTLSSAIAAFLAKGLSVEESVRSAKEYLTKALEHGAGYEIGKGRGPLHHFYKFW
ncbi:MAG: bifunctional hydroxymethylpyrimidine kinase/phosphomethylpyrimidine kinase [Deltaproteobacteria bacterium]|nr:bifunctional hydroxymethylpyrimidine kinase/phosphomethylpyrimidine kinase [Deltaproteobacteria bacterium]